ncbi:MAG: hypothetical protein WCP35_10965 [Verrucomicrobiota bacterium]
MKSHLHSVPLFLLCIAFASAEPQGIDQSLEFVTPPTGKKFIRWHGKPGRSYFVQVSDPADHLNTWHFAPIVESGNDEDISYEVDGTADKGFFRLLYDDRATDDPETDDFDGDGLSNGLEVEYLHTNPYVPNSGAADSNGNGLADAWEMYWFGSLTAQSGDGDADGDGILNKYEQQANTDPTKDETADGDKVLQYQYDSEGRLLAVGGTGAYEFTYDNEGNLESAQ